MGLLSKSVDDQSRRVGELGALPAWNVNRCRLVKRQTKIGLAGGYNVAKKQEWGDEALYKEEGTSDA